MSFLDDLPETIAEALSEHFREAVLTRDVPSMGGTSYDPDVPTETQTFSCRAIHEEWSSSYRANNLVKARDWRILVLAATLYTLPRENDRITLEGVVLTVYSDGGQPAVSSDPAKATWVLRCRS